jgi:hypothetical protein
MVIKCPAGLLIAGDWSRVGFLPAGLIVTYSSSFAGGDFLRAPLARARARTRARRN